ncbi:MAG: hypothetical protein CSYNP_02823 [Syntrophus sp. SKADARSKE-3]|nr:hypothetical protein [Syntrophus sp. SKADARSKE-3]
MTDALARIREEEQYFDGLPTHEEILNIVKTFLAEAQPTLMRRAARSTNGTPYTIEDYMQEAYCTAMIAVEKALLSGQPIDTEFWKLHKATIAGIVSNSIHGESFEDYVVEKKTAANFREQEYSEEILDIKPDEKAKIRDVTDDEIAEALQSMSRREREVWTLSLYPHNMDAVEIARKLNISATGVYVLKQRGLRKVQQKAKKMKNKELRCCQNGSKPQKPLTTHKTPQQPPRNSKTIKTQTRVTLAGRLA